MNKTAVVILNWNGRNYLEQFLPFLFEHTNNADIYVADNASTDDSVLFLQKNFPKVKIILNKENGGFSKGYNEALNQIEAEYYVLVNSDIEVTPNWLDPIIHLMDSDSTIGACQPKIKSFFNRNEFEYAGAAGGFIDSLGYPFCRGRVFDSIEEDKGQYNDERPVFWATGACMVVRANAYHEADGLDEDFFAHMEEIDLCWRMQRRGWKIFYNGKSEVYHVGGGTLSKTNPRKTYLNFRNNLSLLVKNHSKKNFWFKLFIRLVLDGVAGVKFLLTSGFGHFVAVIKAHFYAYSHFFALRTKRINLKKYNHPVYGIYQGSVVWEYYLKKADTFDKLLKENPVK